MRQLAGFFVDAETGDPKLILMDSRGKPHVIPDETHRADTSCPCQPVGYRRCEASYDPSGEHPDPCPFCGNAGFVVPTNPLFDMDEDVFYVHR